MKRYELAMVAVLCSLFACGGSGGSNGGLCGAGGADASGDSGSGGATDAGSSFLEIDRVFMDFGNIGVGTTSTATFTLSNRGAVTSGVPSVRTEAYAAPFGASSFMTVQGCGEALAPGTSCALTISVTPPKMGLYEADVHITASPGATGLAWSSPSLHVFGSAEGFAASSRRFDLGTVAPGTVAKRSFTVTAVTDLSDLQISTTGDDVSVDSPTSTCTATLAQGASCVVNLNFVATAIGWRRDMIGVKAGEGDGQLAIIEMTANVSKASDLAIEPKGVSFACVIEQTSPPITFTITNLAGNNSATVAASIIGESADDFRIAATDCTTLAPYTTCSVQVVCSPPMSSSAAIRHAILSVTDGNTHLSVPLSGDVSL